MIAPLVEAGFRGTWPHYRRPLPDRIELMSFQLDKRGGGFVVVIAKAPATKIRSQLGYAVAATKVTAHHMAGRFRLAPRRTTRNHWYRYDTSTDADRFDALAARVSLHLKKHAVPFWQKG